MSTAIGVVPRTRSRLAFMAQRDFPLIPSLILAIIAFVALFADLLAPHNPEVGSLLLRFRPPFWQQGGSTEFLLAATCSRG